MLRCTAKLLAQIDDSPVAMVLNLTGDLAVGRTQDRSTVGCLNNRVSDAKRIIDFRGGLTYCNVWELVHLLNEVPLKPIGYSRGLKTMQAVVAGKEPPPKTSTATVYQFKITLKETDPPIWRRIQVKDCTLDKLHEHIQTAMGWTNSHLHQFMIGGVVHGDPELLCEGWVDETPPVNSRRTKVSKIIPKDGSRFAFDYEYDFGDSWEHEILFEGCLPAEKGTRYPLCVEGERACPPEDVGGVWSFAEFLKAIADPIHKRHEELLEWSGPYNAEQFDAQAATKEMRKGLPDWRKMEWI